MHVVVGPLLMRNGGYAFDSWTPKEGLIRGYIYCSIEDAHCARSVKIRSRKTEYLSHTVCCSNSQRIRAIDDPTCGIENIMVVRSRVRMVGRGQIKAGWLFTFLKQRFVHQPRRLVERPWPDVAHLQRGTRGRDAIPDLARRLDSVNPLCRATTTIRFYRRQHLLSTRALTANNLEQLQRCVELTKPNGTGAVQSERQSLLRRL
jgi:hypothetical protein